MNVIVDHLADHVMEDYEPLNFDLPDENVLIIKDNSEMNDWWTLYFDGVVNLSRNRAKLVIISQEKK
jgi:hypothetical protein